MPEQLAADLGGATVVGIMVATKAGEAGGAAAVAMMEVAVREAGVTVARKAAVAMMEVSGEEVKVARGEVGTRVPGASVVAGRGALP